ncbi:MAG: glycosyltransferase family 4 protein [Gammaproteobacteria bacterium]
MPVEQANFAPLRTADSGELRLTAQEQAPYHGVSRLTRAAAPAIRVMLVAPSLDILGGQGVQAQALADCLRRDGYRVELLPVNPRFPRWLGRARRYPYLRTLVNQMLYLPSLVKLRRADVVHVFSASYWSFLLAPAPAMLAARLLRKRTLLHYHSGEAEDHLACWGMWVHPWLRLAHEIVVPSEYLRRVFARFGYRAKVVPNVLTAGRFRYRERMPLRPRMLSIRNFEPHYGVDIVIRAFALVKPRFPDASLVVAGYGPEEQRLRRLAASLSVNGIHFTGRVEPAKVPQLYDEADIFLNGALIDNQPVSVLEAFAAGLPVISSGVGDLVNMLQGGAAGCLVPPGDSLAMANAVIGLLQQPQRALRLSRRAHLEAAKYIWGNVRAQWAAAYGVTTA